MKTSSHATVVGVGPVRRRPLGSYLRDAGKLDDAQISRVAEHQRQGALRFGEAAVALQLVSEHDVRAALSAQFDYPLAAGVDAELTVLADPFGVQAEAFRELRSALLLEALPERAPFALAVISAQPADGRTYVAANLAAAFGLLGERTLLIDADLRGGRQERLLGVQGGSGLSNVLAGFAAEEEALYRVEAVGNLWLMPAGALPPNPVELLQRPAFEELLAAMKEKFERIIVDTAPASRGADCRVVAARCDATLLVARKDETRLDALEGLVEVLERGPAPIAGVLLNER